MASIGTISLDADSIETAVGLWLRKKSSFSIDRVPSTGCKVYLRKNEKAVVAISSAQTSVEDTIFAARKAIDETLDIACFRLNDPLELSDQESEVITVRGKVGERTLTYRGYVRWDVRAASMRAVVIDAEGNERPTKEPASWIPALRYYRLSQTREDIFDAYRYMFLALEALLHTKWPKPNSEREWDWLLRAIGELGKHINLTSFVPQPSTDLAEDFVKSQYGEIRLPLFHAKKSSSSFPHEGLAEETVVEAYGRLTKLVRNSLNDLFNMQGPSAALTNYVFQQGFNALLVKEGMQMAFTSDDSALDVSEEKFSPKNVEVYSTDIISAEPESNSDRRMLRATISLSPEMQKSLVGRVGLHVGGDAVIVSRPDTPFSLDGIDRLECQLVVVFNNLNLPKWT